MATIRDNELKLDLGNIFPKVENVKFSIKDHKLTDGQPWEGINRISNSKEVYSLNVRAGRKGKGYVADWFRSKVAGGKAIVCSSDATLPDALNFAFSGDLILTLSDKRIITISNLVIAQGNSGSKNNWWLGSASMDSSNTISTISFDKGSVNKFYLNQTFPDWMSKLNNDTKLSTMSIPGTHNSGTKNYSGPLAGVRCQNFTIDQQLKDGIRFFDIRLCDKGDNLNIYHNSHNCDLSFESVLDQCTSFLKKEKDEDVKETIIMLMDKENTSGNITELFLRKYFTNEKYNKYFYKNNTMPTLGQARGKIVALYRFKIDNNALSKHSIDKKELGIILDNWNFQGETKDSTGNIKFFIQDEYKEYNTPKKYSLVTKYIQESIKNPNIFYINYNSIGYKEANGRTPYMYAWGATAVTIDPTMNPALSSYLDKLPIKCKLGTLMLDFNNKQEGNRNNSIVAKIINRN